MEKDLFYYVFETDERRYSEIFNLIGALDETEELTDEELIFLKDFYFRLLFRIAVLEYKGCSNAEIVNTLNIIKGLNLFNVEQIENFKNKFRIIVDKMKEILENISNQTVLTVIKCGKKGSDDNE